MRRYLQTCLAVIIIAQGSSSVYAQQKTACSVRKGGQHWAWREVDGRRCWYQGRRGKSKTLLYWLKPFVSQPPPIPVPLERVPEIWDKSPGVLTEAPKPPTPVLPVDEHELLESVWPEEASPLPTKSVRTTRERMKLPIKPPALPVWLVLLGLTRRDQ